MIYEWGKDTARKPWHRLRPVGTPAFHVLSSIATIYTATERGRRVVRARYCWQGSSGHRAEDSVVLRSVPQAKQWVERNLAKFWEPPEIKSST